MSKNKLQHFEENNTFTNLYQPAFDELLRGFELRGRWNELFFKNDNPITLELGCGKGEYTLGLARKYKDRNFVGIDWKGARLWRGCKTANEEQLRNVAFVRIKAEMLEYVFGFDELEEIWITFPEPQPQLAKAKKRFTSPQFNLRYHNVLKKNGLIHLKTDNDAFYDYTMEVIKDSNHELLYCTRDLYAENPTSEVAAIQTFYESMWLKQGLKIKYLEYRLNDDTDDEKIISTIIK